MFSDYFTMKNKVIKDKKTKPGLFGKQIFLAMPTLMPMHW
jgi:hypothetical protein